MQQQPICQELLSTGPGQGLVGPSALLYSICFVLNNQVNKGLVDLIVQHKANTIEQRDPPTLGLL